MPGRTSPVPFRSFREPQLGARTRRFGPAGLPTNPMASPRKAKGSANAQVAKSRASYRHREYLGTKFAHFRRHGGCVRMECRKMYHFSATLCSHLATYRAKCEILPRWGYTNGDVQRFVQPVCQAVFPPPPAASSPHSRDRRPLSARRAAANHVPRTFRAPGQRRHSIAMRAAVRSNQPLKEAV